MSMMWYQRDLEHVTCQRFGQRSASPTSTLLRRPGVTAGGYVQRATVAMWRRRRARAPPTRKHALPPINPLLAIRYRGCNLRQPKILRTPISFLLFFGFCILFCSIRERREHSSKFYLKFRNEFATQLFHNILVFLTLSSGKS